MSGLPPVLTVSDVLARYQLRDRRAARKVIDEAGGFHVAGRLVVRVDDLDAHERALAAARRAPREATTPTGALRRGREVPAARKTPREPLAAGWWREQGEVG